MGARTYISDQKVVGDAYLKRRHTALYGMKTCARMACGSSLHPRARRTRNTPRSIAVGCHFPAQCSTATRLPLADLQSDFPITRPGLPAHCSLTNPCAMRSLSKHLARESRLV